MNVVFPNSSGNLSNFSNFSILEEVINPRLPIVILTDSIVGLKHFLLCQCHRPAVQLQIYVTSLFVLLVLVVLKSILLRAVSASIKKKEKNIKESS